MCMTDRNCESFWVVGNTFHTIFACVIFGSSNTQHSWSTYWNWKNFQYWWCCHTSSMFLVSNWQLGFIPFIIKNWHNDVHLGCAWANENTLIFLLFHWFVGFPFVLVLLMLRNFTSNFFFFSFGFCWCMATISQKSFSWFCYFFGIWDLIFQSSSIFLPWFCWCVGATTWCVGVWYQEGFLFICGCANAWEFNFQVINFWCGFVHVWGNNS